MPITYASHWWAWAIRGAVAVLFGILALVLPGVTFGVLVILFGAWLMIDGILHLMIAGRPGVQHRGWHIVDGFVGILLAIFAFVWPLSTGITLVYLVALWAVLTGISRIALAIRLHGSAAREWLIGLGGLLAVLFGIFIFFWPASGALAITLWIGIYAIFAGFVYLGTAFRMRSRHIRLLPLA